MATPGEVGLQRRLDGKGLDVSRPAQMHDVGELRADIVDLDDERTLPRTAPDGGAFTAFQVVGVRAPGPAVPPQTGTTGRRSSRTPRVRRFGRMCGAKPPRRPPPLPPTPTWSSLLPRISQSFFRCGTKGMPASSAWRLAAAPRWPGSKRTARA